MFIIRLSLILSIILYNVDLKSFDNEVLNALLNYYHDEFMTRRGEHMSRRLSIDYIGQIGGLATDKQDNLVIFHRASRKWSFDSFLSNNEFNTKKYGAIEEDVVERVDPKTLKNIQSWGSGLFYMPHGLSVDYEGNYWLTDVALHQVFKFNPNNLTTPSLVLGERFINGHDSKHFCKPTDVVVSSLNGDIFVSDGYCNSRIVHFNRQGEYVREFKMPDDEKQILISHSVALIEDQNIVCVADRENGRIICFDIESGQVESIIEDNQMRKVFAIEYDSKNSLLYAVSGEARGMKPLGFTFQIDSGVQFSNLLSTWEPNNRNYEDPHDVTVSQDGCRVYTGELNGELYEFKMN